MEIESVNVGYVAENKAETERPVISGAGNLKNVVADKLHNLAKTISRKTASTGTNPEVAYYGEQASLMLEQSADYLQQLDLKAVEASARDYIKRNPGRSLLIAGVSGLVIGALLRRRS